MPKGIPAFLLVGMQCQPATSTCEVPLGLPRLAYSSNCAIDLDRKYCNIPFVVYCGLNQHRKSVPDLFPMSAIYDPLLMKISVSLNVLMICSGVKPFLTSVNTRLVRLCQHGSNSWIISVFGDQVSIVL